MQFWEKYPDVRKFFRTHISDAHENTGELITHADDHIVKFFEDFKHKGYLKNTNVMIIADHGPHFFIRHLPIVPDDSRQQEISFPLLIHLAPKNISDTYKQNMKNNEQSFMNSHDIYATLKSYAVGKSAKSPAVNESFSYIYDDIPEKRHCVNTDIYYEHCWCSLDKEYIRKQRAEHWLFYYN